VPRLEVRDVNVRFGGSLALSDVSISADAGCVTGLIGPNGAGKTTMFNVISGLQQVSAGRIQLDGRDITKLSPTKRARQGLGRTFQRLELFTMLSVRDNIRVAPDIHRGWSRSKVDVGARVDELIERVGLAEVADLRVTAVPTGQARLVELARALACNPSVLLLDEPAAGQNAAETERFAELLRELAAGGMAVVLVEHDVQLVVDVCDIIHVLDFGRLLAVGSPAEIQANEAVREAYLGRMSESA
jgi:branched-chain amino acid transport system ATP-binding protein